MILTPRMIILVIGTGLFWLLTLMVALLFVAGLVRGIGSLTIAGGIGLALSVFAYRAFGKHEPRIKRWLQSH